jgi:hypothetical protein
MKESRLMTSEEINTSDTGARHPCVELRPLQFEVVSDDGRVARLRAGVDDVNAPG